MKGNAKKTFRCVVYTRKSSEEGLEQDFNSLEAQREACEAYIRSQAHEGWRLVHERFDDGGFSGGNLDRPALQRLMELVREKRVDIIVIYKIDRLTRSLMDFAKLAELFEKEGVSFVSVTQHFNTTTSMGRLMLNVLLSFAQFEREITGERIRDKIAASKKKGIWMGGTVPIGYDVKDRALVINESEAETVRTIFRLYLKHGSVRKVWEEAGRLGLKTKRRPKSDRRVLGGKRFMPGHIYAVLKCPIYTGRLHHQGQTYPANHAPIIDSETWNAVQRQIADNRYDRRWQPHAKDPSPLAGLIFDAKGTRFTPVHTTKKGGQRYRYYVDQALTKNTGAGRADLPRIPALEIEYIVRNGVATLLRDPPRVLDALGDGLSGPTTQRVVKRAQSLADDLDAATPSTWLPPIRSALLRVVIDDDAIRIQIAQVGMREILGAAAGAGHAYGEARRSPRPYEFVIPAKVRRRGGALRLLVGNSSPQAAPASDRTLVRLIVKAHKWAEMLRSGQANSIRDIATKEVLTGAYVARVTRLAFLAPKIVENLALSRNGTIATATDLLLESELPLAWSGQLTRISA